MKQVLLMLFVLGLTLQVRAQTVVTGTITTEDGESLPGASILETGTTNGTITDVDGNFSLNVNENASLTISFVGFQTQVIPINGMSTITMQMTPDLESLDEVVVVGYGTQKRKDISGSVSSIDKKELEDQVFSNLDNLIQGKAAGVHVVQNNGAPGAGITLRIRGNTSIGSGNEPLYVVDGVPIKSGDYSGLADESRNGATSSISALGDLNPSDIESIEILKDAAAASIYGSRASNGVVLITTKKGSEGKMNVNLDYKTGLQQITRILPVVNALQDRELGYEAWVNNGRIDAFEHFTDTLNPNYNHDTNWQDELFQVAPLTSTNIGVDGGSNGLAYAISLGYLDQEGIIPNSGYKRYSGRINLSYQKDDFFNFGTNIGYTRSINNRINDGEAGAGAGNGTFRGVLNNLFEFQSPMLSPYDVDGNLTYGFNPIGITEAMTNEAIGNRVIGNFYGEIKPIVGLRIRSSIGIDVLGLHENRFIPSILYVRPDEYRQSTARFFEDITWINENLISYQKEFGKHQLTALVGYSQQESVAESILAQRTNASTDNIITVNAGATLSDAYSGISSWAITSLFSRINYAFSGKYLLQLAVRRDGSSRFGKNTRYGNFPSVSVGWRISEESWLSGFDILDDMKLRASLGQTGNQSIPNYISRGLMSTGANYLGQAGITHSSNGLPNNNLTWEKTTQYDLGIDFSLLKYRLSFMIDYYYKNTTDLLFSIPIPTTSGYSSLTTNLGELENKGVEITMGSTIFDKKVGWDINFNIAFNQNKVIALPSGNDIPTNGFGINGLIREGEPLGIFYGYIFDGVYSTTEDVPSGLIMNGRAVEAGDAIFRDLNDDNVIDIEDRAIIGNANPKFVGGFSNTLRYTNFELTAFFNFSYGNDILNRFRAKRDDMARAFPVPSPYIYFNRWQREGDVTDVPIAIQGDPKQNGRKESTRWLEDGSYLRLKALTLSYNVPKDVIEKIKLSKARVYLTGQNLLTFTRYTGYDPELNSSSDYSRGVFGVDIGGYPTAQSIILGVNVGF